MAQKAKESLEVKIKKYIIKKRVMKILFVFLIFGVVFYLFYGYFNKIFSSYIVTKSIEREEGNATNYILYGSNIIKYNKDGITAIDKEGTSLWSGTYEMKNPYIDICEGYVVVGDLGGKKINIFDSKGTLHEIDVLLPIVQVQIANQGVIAVTLEDKKSYNIYLYDIDGNPISRIITPVSESGYPIDITLSNDGTKLVTDYVYVTNGIIESKVTFYSFDRAGQNEDNRIMGGVSFGQDIISKVDFINNNIVIIYKDNGFAIYKMEQKPKLIYEENFENHIESIFSNSKNIGFILENENEEYKYKMLLFDLTGRKKLSKDISDNYEKIYIYDTDIIMYSYNECSIYRINGKRKFNYVFKDEAIEYIMPINGYDRYIFIDSVNINQVRLLER